MKTNTTFTLLLFCLSFYSCKKQSAPEYSSDAVLNDYSELKKASWFLGNWENISDEGNLTEKWVVKNDSTYYAETYFIKGKDTLFSEKVDLIQRGDKLFYIPTVTNQNDNNGIEFVLTSADSNEIIFENPTHDYPKKITYKLINNDSINAQISGNGKSEDFSFKRAQ